MNTRLTPQAAKRNPLAIKDRIFFPHREIIPAHPQNHPGSFTLAVTPSDQELASHKQRLAPTPTWCSAALSVLWTAGKETPSASPLGAAQANSPSNSPVRIQAPARSQTDDAFSLSGPDDGKQQLTTGARVATHADLNAALWEELEKEPRWQEFLSVFSAYNQGPAGEMVINRLAEIALRLGVVTVAAPSTQATLHTPYANTILPAAIYPGDFATHESLQNIIRWNAAALVLRANKDFPNIGGHVATGQSNATLLLTLLFHYLHAETQDHSGDVLFIQGHDSPTCYAFAHLLGELSDDQLAHFRREALAPGLSSYPHARLMPDFWHTSSVSMGLAPQLAIRYAQFDRYARSLDLVTGPERHIWAILGDGSLAEPESYGDLNLAARLGLDNVTFVLNANLLGLDQPVMGNDQVVQNVEGIFKGNGWHVIKLIFGRKWDSLFAADTQGLIAARMGELCDGDLQRLTQSPGATIRTEFFAANAALLALVAHHHDSQLEELFHDWGGHDGILVNTAFQAALAHKGKPTLIIAMTTKGRDMGSSEAVDGTHSVKKLSDPDVLAMRDKLRVPIADEAATHFDLISPHGIDDVSVLRARRDDLGGRFFKERVGSVRAPFAMPEASAFQALWEGTVKISTGESRRSATLLEFLKDLLPAFQAGEKVAGVSTMSSTTAFANLLRELMRDPQVGRVIVPIGADEFETFGMKTQLSTSGVFDPRGQAYTSIHDGKSYEIKLKPKGRFVQVGITESGGISFFTAAGMEGTIPFFICYSAFLFRRVADQIYAAADMRVRGFLVGATAGGTSINGEGLQHQARSDLLIAAANPAVKAYDPAFAFELAVLIQEGLHEMYSAGHRVMYYLTAYNEAIPMPQAPAGFEPEALRQGIIKGLYRFAKADEVFGKNPTAKRAQILSAGTIMMEALHAQRLLAEKFGVQADVWSATSFAELKREAEATDWNNRHHPDQAPKTPYVVEQLSHTTGPIVAVTDYMRAVPNQIAPWIEPHRMTALGTDGFGRSDTREALRDFFGIDAKQIAYTVLYQLYKQGEWDQADLLAAARVLGINSDAAYPPEFPAP